MGLKYTPYDGSDLPFSIGLRPMDIASWIEVDELLPRYLAEKKHLMGEMHEHVWGGDFSSEATQQEVLDILVEHLLEQYPKTYSRHLNQIRIAGVGSVDIEDVSKPPLVTAACLVQEDLVLLRKSAEGWRIVAASVCFPSSWVLREKIGKVMHDVHAPVPGFQKGSRNAGMIERIFDNLSQTIPVERFNWSVYNDDKLFHDDRFGEHFPDHGLSVADYFLRVERQTLRKLPRSEDILFTIRIHIDPLEMLAKRPDKAELGEQFIAELNSMTEDQQHYKGLDRGKDQLIAHIRGVTQNP